MVLLNILFGGGFEFLVTDFLIPISLEEFPVLFPSSYMNPFPSLLISSYRVVRINIGNYIETRLWFTLVFISRNQLACLGVLDISHGYSSISKRINAVSFWLGSSR